MKRKKRRTGERMEEKIKPERQERKRSERKNRERKNYKRELGITKMVQKRRET